jgi:hypothetical protein
MKAWAGVLEASYLCLLLPPFFKNFGKRVVKTPKLYFIDPAIVCALTRQPDAASAIAGSMGGALFEGFVVSEAFKAFSMKVKRTDLYFWRSHEGLEVDLIIQRGPRLIPVEIKLTSTPSLRHVEPLNKFKRLTGAKADSQGLLVCRIEKPIDLPSNNRAIPWHEFSRCLSSML